MSINVPCPNCDHQLPLETRWCPQCKSYRPKRLKTWRDRKSFAKGVYNEFRIGVEAFKKSRSATIIIFSGALLAILCPVFATLLADSLAEGAILAAAVFITTTAACALIGFGPPLAWYSWLLFSIVVIGRDPFAKSPKKDSDFGLDGFMALAFWLMLGWGLFFSIFNIPTVGPYIYHHFIK